MRSKLKVPKPSLKPVRFVEWKYSVGLVLWYLANALAFPAFVLHRAYPYVHDGGAVCYGEFRLRRSSGHLATVLGGYLAWSMLGEWRLLADKRGRNNLVLVAGIKSFTAG